MQIDRRQNVIEKAQVVFRQYGYAKTTMGDLADAAGMSRPSLYLLFPSKKDVFSATVNWISETALAAIRAGIKEEWPLEEKLRYTFETSIGQAYDRVKAHRHAEDLLGFNYEALEIEPSFANLQDFLTEMLRETVEGSRLKASAEEVARTLLTSMRGFKVAAKDGQDLRRLIALEISLVVSALGCGE